MGKHSKLKPPANAPEKSQEKASTSLFSEGESLLRRTMRHLEKLLDAAEQTLASGEANPALARESAGVARAATSLAAELRQQERHAKNVVAAMGAEERDALVRGYLAGLPKDRRDAYRAYLDEFDAKATVL